jgi:hypothetical protein
VKRRQPPPAPLTTGELSDEQAAALERAASRPGWRLDAPDFNQRAAAQILAGRWRRRPSPERKLLESLLTDSDHGQPD